MTKKVEFVYGHNPQQIFIWKGKYRDDQEVTAEQVAQDSQVFKIFKLDLAKLSYALFKEEVDANYLVKDGDRIALLRPRTRVRQEAPATKANPKKS